MIRYWRHQIWVHPLVAFLVSFLAIQPIFTNLWGAEDSSGKKNSPQSTPQGFSVKPHVFVPGDAVLISAFPDTTSFLNQVFPIDDRGYIDLPIIGKVKISDMTRQEFINFLKDNFRDYLRYPYVNVKPLIRVSVLGGVPRPGFYYVDPDQTLWDLIHMVGGTLDEDGLKNMRWERDRKVVEKNLIPYLQKGVSLRSMGFRSGDQIWVRSPGKPGLIDKVLSYTPLVTMALSFFTLYFTYQRTFILGR